MVHGKIYNFNWFCSLIQHVFLSFSLAAFNLILFYLGITSTCFLHRRLIGIIYFGSAFTLCIMVWKSIVWINLFCSTIRSILTEGSLIRLWDFHWFGSQNLQEILHPVRKYCRILCMFPSCFFNSILNSIYLADFFFNIIWGLGLWLCPHFIRMDCCFYVFIFLVNDRNEGKLKWWHSLHF